MSTSEPLEKAFTKGTKVFFIASEIAQRFNGETEATELKDSDRQALADKYRVERGTITAALTGLRNIGLYRDRYFRARQPPPQEGMPKDTITKQLPMAQHPEGSQTQNANETQITTPAVGTVAAVIESQAQSIGTKTPQEKTQMPPIGNSDQTIEELKGTISKQQSMINDLSGQLKGVVEYMQKASVQSAQVPVGSPEEAPQVFEYPKDLLVRKVMWFVPKVLTLHQLYVEDAQKKGDVRPPTFVEWVNYIILEAYRLRQMDLVLARPPQVVKSGLFGGME